MRAHSSMKLLDKVNIIQINFLKAEINLFYIVILYGDFSLLSKQGLKFFNVC